MDNSDRSTSYSTGISREKSRGGGNFIVHSANSNVIIIIDTTQTSRNTNNRSPESVGGSPDGAYGVMSVGNGGSPNNAGGGNPVHINYL